MSKSRSSGLSKNDGNWKELQTAADKSHGKIRFYKTDSDYYNAYHTKDDELDTEAEEASVNGIDIVNGKYQYSIDGVIEAKSSYMAMKKFETLLAKTKHLEIVNWIGISAEVKDGYFKSTFSKVYNPLKDRMENEFGQGAWAVEYVGTYDGKDRYYVYLNAPKYSSSAYKAGVKAANKTYKQWDKVSNEYYRTGISPKDSEVADYLAKVARRNKKK